MIERINNSLLILSSKFGYKKIVKKLINNDKLDTQTQDPKGMTALMWGCKKGYIDIVETLLDANVDVNIQDIHGYSAISWAILGDSSNAFTIVKLLLDKNKYLDLNSQDAWGYTPLMWAADKGLTDIVLLLIQKKADLEIVDSEGYTALMWAILGRSANTTKIVQILLDNGAQVNIFDNCTYTPLMWASEYGLSEVISLLLSKDACVNVKDQNGFTALTWAILGNSKSMIDSVNILLKAGADTKIPDNLGRTPIIYAAASRNEQLLNLLLSQ